MEVHYGRMGESLAHWIADIAEAEQTVGCWGTEEAYLVNRRVAVETGVGPVVGKNLVVAAHKELAVDCMVVDMLGNYRYREEHHTASAAVGSLESPAA